ncbi:MAG: lmo0937 family membrane protein [Leptolyngbya sp. LCM1.Bin17]|nr:MAG: lmo0937 family membrane protein [Leptolyngbya sp. LCM1.Bin17]
MVNLIWTAVVILVILWALGFAVNVGGGLIHLLLVLALIGLVYNLLTGRRVL